MVFLTINPQIALKNHFRIFTLCNYGKGLKNVFKRFDLSKYTKLLSVNNVRDYAWQSDFDIYVKPRFVSRFSAPFYISLKHNLLFARQYLKVFKCRVLAFDL